MTLTVQLPLAAIVPPLKDTLFPEAASVPPQLVAAAGPDWMVSALGKASLSASEPSA